MSRMYEINNKTATTWNPLVGCKFNCSYCYARQMAKRNTKCKKCQQFEPHWHRERDRNFKAGETVFVCSMGDISFFDCDKELGLRWFNLIAERCAYNDKTTFMLQSKDPRCFHDFLTIPDNLILGTTIETDLDTYLISQAPHPIDRISALRENNHKRKYITIEPILKHTQWRMIRLIDDIKPEFVYIGYDNHNHHLNEPTLAENQQLIKDIRSMGIEVREKTIRKAWYEI